MNGQSLTRIDIPLPGGDAAVYTVNSSNAPFHYRHADWLGSARFASSAGETEVYDRAFAPYGESYAGGGPYDLDFTGQTQDQMTGLYGFLYRHYNPVQGRWISPDPLGLGAADSANPQSWNRYAYVSNNPLSSIDPHGLREGQECEDLNGTCDPDEAILDDLPGWYFRWPGTPDGPEPFLPPWGWLPHHRFGDNDCQIHIDASGQGESGGYQIDCGDSSGFRKPPKWWENLKEGWDTADKIKGWWDKYQCAKACNKCKEQIKAIPDPMKDSDWLNHRLDKLSQDQANGLPVASETVNANRDAGTMFPASEDCQKCGECSLSLAVTGGIPSK